MAVVTWYSPAGLSGLGLAVMLAAAAGLLVLGLGDRRRPLLAAAVGGVTFQVVHFVEHLAQLGYWLGNTDEPPWLTPWAEVARDGLAFWCQVFPGKGVDGLRGVEMLHLIGNLLFLAGAVALAALIDRRGVAGRRAIQRCIALQGFHVAEHVLLTVSVFTTGRSLGISTLFGAADPGTDGAVAYRVLFHFTINLVATAFVVIAAAAAARSARSGGTGDGDAAQDTQRPVPSER